MNILVLVDPIVKLLDWQWLSQISIGSIIIRIVLAILIGGILGFERTRNNHAAGLRTYMLVCLGAAVAMITNQYIIETYGTGDAARLGAQVISGIGFLGAGTILVTSRNQIRGLTTAAGLWACACLGLAVGTGFYTVSLIASILITIILAFLPKFEESVIKKSRTFDIHIEFNCRANLKDFLALVRANDLKVVSIEHNPAYSASGLSVYSITLKRLEKAKSHAEYLVMFKNLEYVQYVEEMK